ncbi:MAG: hypothetical protein ABIX01_04005 [Chitinophagaceae bacterium]
MRLEILLLLAAVCTHAKAQDDDVPDYRKRWESFSKVPEKDIRRDLAAFAYGGVDESMGKDTLRSMPTIGVKDKTMKWQEGTTQVLITTGTFDPIKHKLFYSDIEKKHLQKIDGKGFYGDYGTMPKVTIASVTMIVDKDTVRVPEVAFKDIYNPRFVFKDKAGIEKTLSGVYYSPDKITMYIHLVNREVPDKYEVTWVIRDRKFLKRVVDYDLP